ncbi:hypothetical protein SAMN05880545_1931 [Microbacterium sp. RU33B]|nr:hypothetical protein SAMN05880545_1931 [Microbacterium sp. RU33B]
MQVALNADGPLTDQAAEGGEREATMKLFAGAIGAFARSGMAVLIALLKMGRLWRR